MVSGNFLNTILRQIDIEINGTRPWDPQVYDAGFFDDIARGGALAIGEGYMDKRWDVDALDDLVYRMQKHNILWDRMIYGNMLFQRLRDKFFNRQKGARAFEVAYTHYDLGNDLYQKMLDSRMIYTCAYWKDAKTLDEAQEAKLDLICRKLDLKKGDRVLDIGCGWGGFMKYAVEKYGVTCVGISVSKEQIAHAKKVCEGLPIEFVLMDYADYVPEKPFDHIVSIEMFEAVGHRNYPFFMKKVFSWLSDDGRFLLQTIGTAQKIVTADPWIDRYIFPNGILPTRKMIERATSGLFITHDWHDIGHDYDRTLMEWWKNFQKEYPTLDQVKYDSRFYRMWKYYLLSCAGGFRAGHLLDWQIVFTKPHNKEALPTIR